jgi:UDP-N-acetylmuramoylalanine-D-glutamate ligase
VWHSRPITSQPNPRKKERKDKWKNNKVYVRDKKNLYVHEIKTSLCEIDERWEMREENEKRKKKSMLWSYEREMRNKIIERVDEWKYSSLLIKIDEYFHSPKLFD